MINIGTQDILILICFLNIFLGVSRKLLIHYGMNITIISSFGKYVCFLWFSIFANRLGRESIQANEGLLYLPKNH